MENKRGEVIITWTYCTAQTLLVIFFMRLRKLQHLEGLSSTVPDTPHGFSLSWSLYLCGFLLFLEHSCPSGLQASLMQCLYVEWPLPSLFLKSFSHPSRPTSNLDIFCENFHCSPWPKVPSALPSAPGPSHYSPVPTAPTACVQVLPDTWRLCCPPMCPVGQICRESQAPSSRLNWLCIWR